MRSTKSRSWTERLLGLEPVPLPPHVFAVESGRLRYAGFSRGAARKLASGRGTLQLVEYHEEALPDVFAHGPLGGPLREPAPFREALGRLLGRLGTPLREASLVLPDAWLRVVFSESGELPRPALAGPDRRDEMLRWRLKRMVPFRVEDLRVAAVEIAPLPRQEEPRRVVMGFAVEALLAGLESELAAHKIHVGHITNGSLALLGVLGAALRPHALAVVVALEPGGYTVLVTRHGEIMLHRGKALGEGVGGDRAAAARDLRLLRTFLGEHLPDVPLARALLVAPGEVEAQWSEVLTTALGAPVEAVRREALPVRLEGPPVSWRDVLPLAGAASLEVA